jgi:hypothetical protein
MSTSNSINVTEIQAGWTIPGERTWLILGKRRSAVLTWLVIPERIEDSDDGEDAELDHEDFTLRRKIWPKRK